MSAGHGTSEKSTGDYDALGRIFRSCDTASKGSAAVVTLIRYMRESMSLYGGYDGSPEILEELQSKLLHAACRNGEVTWDQFRESSQRWLHEIRPRRLHPRSSQVTEQDGNNNFDADRSENFELELELKGDRHHSDGNEEDEEFHGDGPPSPIPDDSDAMSVGFLDSSTVSNYSTSTVNTTRCESPNDHSMLRSFVAPDGNSDGRETTGESSAELVELRAKIRRVTAENADLRDGLQRDEEAIDSLQQRLADVQRLLAQKSERCGKLEKDNAEQKELLGLAERNNELLKATTQRLERETRKTTHLAKYIEELEAERQRSTIESEQLRRTNKEMTKRIADYQIKLDEEHALRDEQGRAIITLRADNDRWREAHRVLEDTNQRLRDAVKELEAGLSESRMNQGSFAVFGSLNFGLNATLGHVGNNDNDNDNDNGNDYDDDAEEEEEEDEAGILAATHHPVATGRGFGRFIPYSLHDELKATPPLEFALGERKDAATQLCLDAVPGQGFSSTNATFVYPSPSPYAESSTVRETWAIPSTERTHRRTSATLAVPDGYQSHHAWRSPDKPYDTSSEDESSGKTDSTSTSIADGRSRPNNESIFAKDDDFVGRRVVFAVKVEGTAPEGKTTGPEAATPERDRRIVVPAISPGSSRPPTLEIIAPAPAEITEFRVCDDDAGFTRPRCRYDRENSTESVSVARAMSTGEDSSDCDSSRRDDEPAATAAAAAAAAAETHERTRVSLITASTVTGSSMIPGLPVASSSPREIGLATSRDDDAGVGMLPSSRACQTLLSSNESSFANEREPNDEIEESAERSTTQRKECERARRSLSEGDSGGPSKRNNECSLTIVESTNGTATDEERVEIFPSLSDRRLLDLGLSSIPGTPNVCETMNEDDLERKYTALSLGLETDRITMDRRVALGRRQRDQAERNLDAEVGRTRRDVQALAPLCVDRESVERVERVKHQLEMIARCAHRVSSTAELLGAVHQERRVSRAALLADRYLQSLRAKCDKLATELAETKRILSENHIVVEENANELGDELPPRVRYRGLPTNNRTTAVNDCGCNNFSDCKGCFPEYFLLVNPWSETYPEGALGSFHYHLQMTRRRASIAAISRPLLPLGISTEMTKTTDNGKQRNPNTGRIPARRPSLSYDVQKWDHETLDRTDSSSSSIGELREIFEQAESRRSSREENSNGGNHNGLFRSQSSNFSVGSCESADSDVWASPREDSTPDNTDELLSIAESGFFRHRRRQILKSLEEYVAGVPVMWCLFLLVAFLFGYYSRHRAAVDCAAPYKWWSIEEMLRKYHRMQRYGPPPV